MYLRNIGYGIDIYYIILVLPAIIIAMIAQLRVKTTFSRYENIYSQGGSRGYEVARSILDQNGLHNIPIERDRKSTRLNSSH